MTVFMWLYALLSPFGGFVADKFKPSVDGDWEPFCVARRDLPYWANPYLQWDVNLPCTDGSQRGLLFASRSRSHY
jgi:hypothetical protein